MVVAVGIVLGVLAVLSMAIAIGGALEAGEKGRTARDKGGAIIAICAIAAIVLAFVAGMLS